MLDFIKTPIIKSYIGKAVRLGLAAGVGWLVKRGLASSDVATKLVDDLEPVIVGVIWLGWEWVQAQHAKKVDVALSLPQDATHADLHAAMKQTA